MKCYKIREISSGEFVVGDRYSTNKTGKIWNKINHVKSHMKRFLTNWNNNELVYQPYKGGGYELVEYEMKEIGSTPI